MNPSTPPQLYGTQPVAPNRSNIWDRIYGIEHNPDGTDSYNRFKPDDFVRVMNIDDETFYWQALDPRDEEVIMEGSQFLPMKNTIRKDPKIYSIPAGATMVLEGWNAAKMINDLYKKIAAKRASNKPLEPGQKIRNFAFGDERKQEEYISKIFVGVERPAYEVGVPITQPATETQVEEIKADPSVSELAKELGLDGGSKQS